MAVTSAGNNAAWNCSGSIKERSQLKDMHTTLQYQTAIQKQVIFTNSPRSNS